ncbi:MAG: NAD(P)H-dependent oxidoreductase [Spirochaetes bacterium]|nr:NAD(P)H-dependent oxidoreductase [Spirochaetota bacterium]
MKISVLNGSPKGDMSITMQYVRYMEKQVPGIRMTVHDISLRIKALEKDAASFRAVMDDVRSSDLVLWAFPLYYFLVPSQYKRFIELIFERKAAAAFRSKFTAVITTSIHFFDHTAHNYMRGLCDDLAMKFAGSFSASMYDLVRSAERERFRKFIAVMLQRVSADAPASRAYVPVKGKMFPYRPSKTKKTVDPGSRNILILSDAGGASSNLARMVERLRSSFAVAPQAYNLHDLDIKGGCLGCIQCAYDNTCVYGDSDGFHEFYETRVKKADIIFYCMETRDRYISSLWKRFIDRTFYNNHTPVLGGKQIGFLVSGPLSELSSLREFLQIYPEFQRANLVDIVTDECGDSKELDRRIQALAGSAVSLAESDYVGPFTFGTVGGWKIFRDEIWSWMRFPFIADHTYYKKHGMYDFPRRSPGRSLVNGALAMMVKIPGFRDVVYKKRMKEEMLAPLKRILKRE